MEEEIIEDWFIIKGINSFLENPDSVPIDRALYNKKYIEDTLNGETRVSYMKQFIKQWKH